MNTISTAAPTKSKPVAAGETGRGYRLGYLVSQYPAVSHTFIHNEIIELRALGFEVATCSINACDRARPLLPESERAENDGTFYVKPAGWRGALQAIFATLRFYPIELIRGLFFTIQLGGNSKRYFYFLEALMIARWMRARGLRHLHTHFGTSASTAALIAAHTFPITLSFTIHGPDEFHEITRNYLPQKISAAQFVCCIGMFARSQLMRICPVMEWPKLQLVPLGVDPGRFTAGPELLTAETRRAAPGWFEVVCVGRLVPAKGQHVLLAAVAALVEEGRLVRLRLIGDGPDRASLERRIAERGLERHVILEGAVNQDRVPGFLKQADALALASFAEGIPVALMEAMACEIPCVSTAIAGIPELIRDEVDGLLVPPSDERALAAALRRLMDDPQLRQRLGAAGRARVTRNFHLKTNVARLAEVYKCHLSPR